MLRGFLEGEDGVHGVAAVARLARAIGDWPCWYCATLSRAEKEDAEGDGHDVSRELTAGVDGRAACVRGKDRGEARRQ